MQLDFCVDFGSGILQPGVVEEVFGGGGVEEGGPGADDVVFGGPARGVDQGDGVVDRLFGVLFECSSHVRKGWLPL